MDSKPLSEMRGALVFPLKNPELSTTLAVVSSTFLYIYAITNIEYSYT